MMGWWVVLGILVCFVCVSWSPVHIIVALINSIADPMESHVHCFGPIFLFCYLLFQMHTNCRLVLVLLVAYVPFRAVSLALVLLFGHCKNRFHIMILILRTLHYLWLYTLSGLGHLVEIILVVFWVTVVYCWRRNYHLLCFLLLVILCSQHLSEHTVSCRWHDIVFLLQGTWHSNL